MTTPTDVLDVDSRVEALNDIDLIKAHAALHALPVVSEAEVHAHHALARQMALRGVPTGYGDDDPLSKVRILIESEVIKADTAFDLLDEDLADAVDQFAAETGLTEVGIATFLTSQGYEAVVLDPLEIAASLVSAANDGVDLVDVTKNDEMLKHPGHPDQQVHAGGRGGKVATGSLIDKTRENGGLTIRANGQEPKAGYIVAVRGHNREIPEAEFYGPGGHAAVSSWIKDNRENLSSKPGQPGRWIGVWHDKANGEVVLDVVEQHMSQASAVKAGRDRNQQAIWDVKNFAEIATGGTGDRADKSAGDARADAGLHDDDRRADRRVGDGADAGPAAAVEKRRYVRDSHGRFATVGTGGNVQSTGSNRHGGEYLDAADHKTLRRLQSKRALAMDYNDSYDRGAASRTADATPGMLGRFHDRMKANMATIRTDPARTPVTEVLASNVVQDAGWIDGALGNSRKYKRPLFGTTGYGAAMGGLGRIPEAFGKAIDPLDDFEVIAKRQYVRDSQGQFAVTGGSSRAVLDPGKDKPDLLVITDPFGDEIRLTKADSLYHHMERKPDGSWGLTAEREAMHRDIVDEAMAGVPKSKDPTMYMLGGGPAAGKSTMLEKGGLDVPSTGEHGSKRQAVLVNADEVKVRLPEYGQMGKNGASFVHEESSLVAKRIQGVAIAAQRDVVLDGTGDSKVQKLAAKIDQARSAGYKVEGHYATVPTNVAWERAHARALKTGRHVPESVVRGTHADVSRTFPQAHHLFDKVNLYDTSNGARRVASGTRGSPLEIHDRAAYKAFLDKGQE